MYTFFSIHMNNRNFRAALVVVTITITLPYILAALAGGPERVFTGFLLNPADGASYLAKMRQGFAGSWLFTLPFTAEPGEGTYLFLFYLFLGKLARLTGLSLQMVFHLARVLGAWLLLASLRRFVEVLFANQPEVGKTAFWLMVIGSGMGWLVLWIGEPTTDFWVAEAYPFLSMFANPHFAVGLALLIYALTLFLHPVRGRNWLLTLIGLVLSVILPFGLVVALVVAAIWMAWKWLLARPRNFIAFWMPLVSLGVLGGPFLLYQNWIAVNHPVLAGWNAQNLTPSPPLWDFILSFSPLLPLAVFGLVRLRQQPLDDGARMLIVWFAAGLLLAYLPISLQRRFLLGWYIPVAGLGVLGLYAAKAAWPRIQRKLTPLVFGLALPTNLLILLIALFGILSRAPEYYLNRDEVNTFAWLSSNTPADALVLASPELGLWLPGWTGRRVIYGHPFETVNAKDEEAWVEAFYAASGPVQTALLEARAIDYVIVGPREQALGETTDFSALPVVYTSGHVKVRAARGTP